MGHHLGVSIETTAKADELLVLVTSLFATQASKLYKERWTIEVSFQSLKGREFNLEESCLKCEHKMKKMVALVRFSLCYLPECRAGNGYAEGSQRQKSWMQTHSFFRNGLQILRYAIKNYTEETFSEALAWLDWLYNGFPIPKIIHSQ